MTGSPERRDESVTFSLKELMKLEDERICQERQAREARELAVKSAREDAERREREELAAKDRAAEEERERARFREMEEEARREAMQRAAIEQARITVEARTRAEESDREVARLRLGLEFRAQFAIAGDQEFGVRHLAAHVGHGAQEVDDSLLRGEAADEEHLRGGRRVRRRHELRRVHAGVVRPDLLRRATGLAQLLGEELGDAEHLVRGGERAAAAGDLGGVLRRDRDIHAEVGHDQRHAERARDAVRGDRARAEEGMHEGGARGGDGAPPATGHAPRVLHQELPERRDRAVIGEEHARTSFHVLRATGVELIADEDRRVPPECHRL